MWIACELRVDKNSIAKRNEFCSDENSRKKNGISEKIKIKPRKKLGSFFSA